jgi:hypothetical protein
MTQRRFPDTAYHAVTMIGAALASVCLATIAVLTGVELLQQRPPPYIGIISYVIVPVPLLLGLLLIPIGMWRERRRLRAGKPASASVWVIDLHVPKHQAALLLCAGVTTVFPLLTVSGSDRTFPWTASVGFCGTTECNGEGPLEGWHSLSHHALAGHGSDSHDSRCDRHGIRASCRDW